MKRSITLNRLALTAGLAATLLGLALPAAASAHPLGNFTINRYDGLTLAPAWAHLDRVVDMAELPTVQARQEMDVNHDRTISDAETAAWATERCTTDAGDLSLTVAGRAAVLQPAAVGITFAAGQAGLATLRLVCTYSTELHASAAGDAVSFADTSYPDRQGWREIVVTGRGLSLTGVDQYASGVSDRLRRYPAAAAASVRAQSAASFSIAAITSAEPSALPSVTDAVPLGSAPALIVGLAALPSVVPGGISDLPAEISALIQADDLTVPAIIIAIMVAALVGAFHAATPGHGKTLMAAYLVGSRGTVGHALALGMTVTVAHTIGVLALGALVLLAGATLPAERLFPVLGLASGVVVTLLGAVFLFQRIRAARHEHEHGRSPGHDNSHTHGQGPDTDGWHAHGPLRHTHLPAADGPLRRRNLIALGLVGGLVPSASAILILVGSIAAGRPAFGMILTVAFGAGMAAVLVGVGVLLVRARSLIERLPSRNLGRVLAHAPLITAVTFIVVGVAITLQAGSQLR